MRGPNLFLLFRDGGAWCAVPPRFRNLQDDPAGFGATREEAVSKLLGSTGYQEWAKETAWSTGPTAADFREVSEIPFEPDPEDPDDWDNEDDMEEAQRREAHQGESVADERPH